MAAFGMILEEVHFRKEMKDIQEIPKIETYILRIAESFEYKNRRSLHNKAWLKPGFVAKITPRKGPSHLLF